MYLVGLETDKLIQGEYDDLPVNDFLYMNYPKINWLKTITILLYNSPRIRVEFSCVIILFLMVAGPVCLHSNAHSLVEIASRVDSALIVGLPVASLLWWS